MVKKSMVPKAFKSLDQVDFSPVFVVGTNRCGSSIVGHVMNQHPQLEGLFSGETSPGKIIGGHSDGFCESGHIWSFLLDADASISLSRGLRPVWGHPKYISHYYRDEPHSDGEALLRVNAIQKYRETDRIPLIKDQMNILRIGLIRAIFPRAKFVIVIRDYPDYIESCYHKWLNSKWFGSQETARPCIGLHWLTLNNLALFELESCAAGDYAVILYGDLFNRKRLETVFQSALVRLGLCRFDFNFDDIDAQHRYLKSEVLREHVSFRLPCEIARREVLMQERDLG